MPKRRAGMTTAMQPDLLIAPTFPQPALHLWSERFVASCLATIIMKKDDLQHSETASPAPRDVSPDGTVSDLLEAVGVQEVVGPPAVLVIRE